jgi:hypothetical protein
MARFIRALPLLSSGGFDVGVPAMPDPLAAATPIGGIAIGKEHGRQ